MKAHSFMMNSDNMANHFLGLSLFIMLLAFFIILNAISSFEVTKSQPVLNSLSIAFSSKEAVEVYAPGKEAVANEMAKEGSTLDKIEALFKSQITDVQTKQNRLGTQMIVKMPFSEFQRSMMSSLRLAPANRTISGRQPVNLLPMLVSLLESQRNVPYKMDMLRHTQGRPSAIMAQNPDQFMLMNKSISAIATKLEESGLPKKQITVGLKQGEPDQIELMFRRYEPFNPLGIETGSEQEGQL